MYGRLLHLWIMDKNVSFVTVLFRRIKKLVMVNYQKMDIQERITEEVS